MAYDWNDYLNRYADVATWLKDARKEGIFTTGGDYTKKYGKDTTNWEPDWLSKANEKYGREETDLGAYSRGQLAELHYDIWGKNKGRTVNELPEDDIRNKFTEIEGIFDLDQDAKDAIKRQVAEQYYQQGPDIKTFQTMLDKLTGAKMKQQGQLAAARRGDTYAGGLANMMGNF